MDKRLAAVERLLKVATGGLSRRASEVRSARQLIDSDEFDEMCEHLEYSADYYRRLVHSAIGKKRERRKKLGIHGC